jgi:uncharacterized membrane protein (DUF2068 family)
LTARIHHPHDPHWKGLRTVATLEFSKGVVVLLLTLGIATLIERERWPITELVLEFFRIDPAHKFAHQAARLLARFTGSHFRTAAAIAFAYCSLRFVEAYGLWHARAWAEWLGIVSGGIYLPFEIAALVRRPNWLHVAVLLVNVVIVLYLAYLRASEIGHRRHSPPAHA